MTAVIVGASAGLGRALAEECARRGYRLLLAARDLRDLDALAKHLRLVHGVEVETCACELHDPERAAGRIGKAAHALGAIDVLLLPAGGAEPNDNGLSEFAVVRRALEVNYLSVVAIVGALWPLLAKSRSASIVGFGSIAAIRGRKSNVAYASAKRALLSFFESLQHRASGTPMRVHFYQPGYLATAQTFGKRLLLPPAGPERLARIVVTRLGCEERPHYYPSYWGAIAVVLRNLPWFIYRRIDF